MTKRILAISNHAFMLGGGEYSFLDFLCHLSYPWNVLAVVPGEGELTTRLRKKGIDTHLIPLPSIRPWYVLKFLRTLRTYFDLCRRFRPALIYSNGSRATLYGGIVGRLLDVPVIWHCRMADPDRYLDFILKRLSSRIIANSQATAKRFGQRFKSKVTVVYNGVDIGWLRDESVPRPGLIGDAWKVILLVARVSRWKRHDIALLAFEQVAASDPSAHLVCVGARDVLEPEWWKYLQDRSHESKVSNRIHWVDQVEDVRPWYRAAYVLVLSSDNEPFGRVLVEAMACGIPVVATRCGGVPEIVRHKRDGLLVSPGKPEEMAKAIQNIVRDKTLRKNLAHSALMRAGSFSLDAHVEKMLQTFENTTRA